MFCTYFPYNAKLCINGHEYVKRQLTKEGIAFEALDNGILSCADPQRLQPLCDGLSAESIDALARKWLARLPHPFTREDCAAGYRYEVSILEDRVLRPRAPSRPVRGRKPRASSRHGVTSRVRPVETHEANFAQKWLVI